MISDIESFKLQLSSLISRGSYLKGVMAPFEDKSVALRTAMPDESSPQDGPGIHETSESEAFSTLSNIGRACQSIMAQS